MPGEGQCICDVAGERLVKARELIGGKSPVDGWIAPSNEAHGAALLSDAFSRPGVDPPVKPVETTKPISVDDGVVPG